MAQGKKWQVIANKTGQTVSRHVLRRLEIKAKQLGIVSDWDRVDVLDDGSLMLSRPDRVGSVIAKQVGTGKSQGRGSRWEFQTYTEHLNEDKEGKTDPEPKPEPRTEAEPVADPVAAE